MLLLSNECLCLIRNGELSLCAMRPESLPVPVSRFDTLSPLTLYWDRHLASLIGKFIIAFAPLLMKSSILFFFKLIVHRLSADNVIDDRSGSIEDKKV